MTKPISNTNLTGIKALAQNINAGQQELDFVLEHIFNKPEKEQVQKLHQLFVHIEPSQYSIETAIKKAAERGDSKLVKVLMDYAYRKFSYKKNELPGFYLDVLESYEPEMLRVLLSSSKYTHPGTHNNWALIGAAAGGHTACVELLLKDKRINPSSPKNLAFKRAVQNGHITIAQLLLRDPRVAKAAGSYTDLETAVYEKRETAILALIHHKDATRHLVTAAKQGNRDVVEALMKNKGLELGEALPYAALFNRTAIVDTFLKDERITEKMVKKALNGARNSVYNPYPNASLINKLQAKLKEFALRQEANIQGKSL